MNEIQSVTEISLQPQKKTLTCTLTISIKTTYITHFNEFSQNDLKTSFGLCSFDLVHRNLHPYRVNESLRWLAFSLSAV